MDGDIARLDVITSLAKEYNCRVMVDDAHGVGVVGKWDEELQNFIT